MKNPENRFDHVLKIIVVGGILLVALSFAYYFLLRPLQLENARKACSERISEQREKAKQLYADENCDQLPHGMIKLDSDEYNKSVVCKEYKERMTSSSKINDDDFKSCLREKGITN